MAAGDISVPGTLPAVIGVRGARHNNLRDIDVDVPLWRTVAVVGVVCGARFAHPSAESFAFNSYGACPACQGLGVRSEVDVATLVPDPDKTIAEGAVLPWNSGGRRLSMYAAGELGVRLDVPYRSLTDHERDIVLHGEPVRRQVTLHSGRNGRSVQLSVNYDNAVAAVERSLRSDNERTRRLVQRFLVTRVCSVCHGTRLRPEALASRLGGRDIAEISALSLDDLRGFAAGLPAGLPAELSRMTTGLLAELGGRLTPLLDVGLGYLTLDRAGASLSTGERQRIELTSTVRASTTGMLYVLDEPSTGLHPLDVGTLAGVFDRLLRAGATIIAIDHDLDLLAAADHLIDMGPGGGPDGGRIITAGTPEAVARDPRSVTGPWLAEHLDLPEKPTH
jgi:excinuclease ABC subunit A